MTPAVKYIKHTYFHNFHEPEWSMLHNLLTNPDGGSHIFARPYTFSTESQNVKGLILPSTIDKKNRKVLLMISISYEQGVKQLKERTE